MIRKSLVATTLCLSSTLLAQGTQIEGAPPPPSAGEVVLGPGPIVPGPAAATIVPASAANAITNRANSIPWSWTPTRFQAPYLEADMPATLLIRCLGFRHGNRTDTGATIDLEMWLGYTTFDHTTITANYASNANSGALVQVYTRKKYNVVDMETPNADPKFFKNQIPLDKPFVWTKQTGRNLLWEAKVHGNSSNNTSFSYFPEQGTSNTTRVYSNNNANATTGNITRNLAPVLSLDTVCQPIGQYEVYGAGCRGTGGFSGHVVPAKARTSFLNSANAWTLGSGPQRWQQQINASQMPTAPTMFVSYNQRDDEVARTAGANTMTLKVSFGMTTKDSTTMTNTYATNADRPQTVVFNGNVNMPAVSGGAKGLQDFVYVIKLSKNYLYIPKAGEHFLVEIVNTTAARVARYPDAESHTTAAQGTRVYANGAPTAATGVLDKDHCMAIGFGTAGAGNATPVLGNVGRPVTGKTFDVTLGAAKSSTASLLSLGSSDKTWGAIPLPFDLKVLGAPGCNVLASPDILLPAAVDANGDAKVTLTIPNVTGLVGVIFFNQYLVADAGANAFGIAVTNGGKATVGAQ